MALYMHNNMNDVFYQKPLIQQDIQGASSFCMEYIINYHYHQCMVHCIIVTFSSVYVGILDIDLI